MQCPKCNTENREGAKFCLKCGVKLDLVCPQCRTELLPDAMFCDACGAQVSASPAETVEEPVAPVLDQALQRLVPKEFAEQLLATRGQVGKERRIVTILFSDVKGSTAMAEKLDPEDWVEIMEGAFDVLIEPIYRYEGTVARLMGDAILAFFGAPIAHEDDPERACRAALEIIEGAQRYAARLEEERGISGFNVRVGINTGLVVVGEVGSDLRVEYTAMGDAVNVAARMEQNAPVGGILISHDTYRHVRGVFDVQPQEPLTVKGKSEPVQTYVVLRAKPRAFRLGTRGVEGIETRMIGREAELLTLQNIYRDAIEDAETRVVTVVGEAGVGKSRLLYEFDNWAELRPELIYYFKGRATAATQAVPYSVIRDLFCFRFQIQDSDRAGVVRDKLERGIGEALGESGRGQVKAHCIGQLLGFDFSDSPHLRGVLDDAKQLRDWALMYLGEFFEARAKEAPTVIFLEDLHWADDSSLDAINHMALTVPDQPLLIVCLARPALFERRPHWGEGQAFHARLELQPLSKRDTRRLVGEILQKAEQVPETLRELVVSGAEGNPFYVEELIKMLIEDGVIVKGEDRWRVEVSRLPQVRVPTSLTGVLQARLDRLPLAERTVLQQASVVGRLFWDRAVACITESAREGIDKSQVPNTLSALRGRELIFQRETSAFAGAREYIFKHAVLREVTYESVLKRVRRVYHGLVADWLMEEGGERVGEYTGLIADHLELAGRAAEAADYLLLAGDQARGLYAHQEAIDYYQRALAFLKEQGEHERAARTLMKLGLTYHTAFDFRSARQVYEEGFALWQRAGEMGPAVPPPPAPHALRVDWLNPPTLDSTMVGDETSAGVIEQLFSGLVELTPEMDIVPEVARTWEVSEGGRKYVFHLRDDVRWSDGTPVTAGDFEYAWKRALDPATGSPLANLLYDVKGARAFHQGEMSDPDLVGVEGLDEATLVVELEGPTGYFLQLLVYSLAYPVPRHVVETYGEGWTEVENIVTNGPFRLEAWQRGESMVLVRNPEYHGRSRGNLQRVELFFLADPSARLEMYEADGLDIINLPILPPPEMDRARQRHAGEYVSGPNLGTWCVGFDVSRPPFDDVRVRRAFVMATDRETLANVAVRGYQFPATGGFVPPGMPGHSPGIGLPYDPDRARQLLAEAGYPVGHGFPAVDALTSRGNEPAAEYLQAQWRENLGVEIPWETMEWAMLLDRVRSGPPDMAMGGWVAKYPDPDSFLRVCVQWYLPGWRNEAYDRLVEQARRITDQGERMKLYGQADRILIEEALVLPLVYERFHLLVKPWVTKYPTSAIQLRFWKDVIIEPH